MHKGVAYPGEHDAIIDHKLWDGVQAIIQESPRNMYIRPPMRLISSPTHQSISGRCWTRAYFGDGSCVDGSGLARTFFTFCSIGRCSHVSGLLMRFT